MKLFPLKYVTSAIKYWWINLIVGVLFIIVGLGIIHIPQERYFSLSVIFALFFILIGVSQAYYSFSNRRSLPSWSWYFSNGILDFIVGIILIWRPFFSAEILSSFIAFWLIYKSIYGVSFSIELKEYGVRIWWLLLSVSIVLIILSIILVGYPIFQSIDAITNTSTSFILLGIIMIVGSLVSKNLHKLPLKIVNKYTTTL